MILHIPHAANEIPADVRDQFPVSDQALSGELLQSTDWFTDELFACPAASRISFPVSRLVVDPERFAQDAEEPMSPVGRGAIYTRMTTGAPLRRALSPEERTALFARFYYPHHARLRLEVTTRLEQYGSVLIVDAHSFPETPWAIEPQPGARRPDFCIGTDDYHTPAATANEAMTFFAERGYSVLENEPYAGAIVPLDFYRREPRVRSIMVEVNRRLYMDENTGVRSSRFSEVQGALAAFLEMIAARN